MNHGCCLGLCLGRGSNLYECFFTMTRFLLFILLCWAQVVSAQNIDTQSKAALEALRGGYVQYAFTEFKRIAALNDMAAQYYLAWCNQQGVACEKNLNEAFRLYRRAAERGLPDAMPQLAAFYQNGIVVTKDEGRYKEWMERYQKKGGKCLLADIVEAYNGAQQHVTNFALNPKTGGPVGAQQPVGQVASNDQTVNHITIVQQVTAAQPSTTHQPNPSPQKIETKKSDIDVNIPSVADTNDNTFALIIANEAYQNVAPVPNALNDGQIFADYCAKTLGLPKANIHLVCNATYTNIKRELNLMQQIAEAYQGKAKFIIYYAGHGLPDEASKDAYLMPIDGYGADLSTCFSLNHFYASLGSMPSAQVVVLMDACFSGSLRGEGMLASARGVAIKAKSSEAKGNMVVLSAAQGDETAYPLDSEHHGMFTYYLLKKMKETKGAANLGALYDYVKDNVVKKSLVINGKRQTPTSIPSTQAAANWRQWMLK